MSGTWIVVQYILHGAYPNRRIDIYKIIPLFILLLGWHPTMSTSSLSKSLSIWCHFKTPLICYSPSTAFLRDEFLRVICLGRVSRPRGEGVRQVMRCEQQRARSVCGSPRIISVWGQNQDFEIAFAKPLTELGSYLGHSARGRCTTSILLLQNP